MVPDPRAFVHFAGGSGQRSFSMYAVFRKLTDEGAVDVCAGSFALGSRIYKLPDVLVVFGDFGAPAVQHVAFEFALPCLTIGKGLLALAFHLAMDPLAGVDRSEPVVVRSFAVR